MFFQPSRITSIENCQYFKGMKIGDRIRKIRREKELSQEFVAERLGVTQAYISAIENNKSDLNSDLISKLAQVLDVSPSEFFSNRPESPAAGPDNPDSTSSGIHFSLPGFITKEEQDKITKLMELIGNSMPEDRKLIYDIIEKVFNKEK